VRDADELSPPEQLLARVLAGLDVGDALVGVDSDAFHRAATDHDVLPLAAERLAGLQIPETLRARCSEDSAQAAAADLAREVELRRFLREIETTHIVPLLLKGSHLAYSHYPRSDLRPRADSDLLIPTDARTSVHSILTERLGYVASSKVSGEMTLTQKTYLRYDGEALVHAFDVHWRVASPPVFANLLSYGELAQASVPLPRLATNARGPSNVHALLLACVHRVAHHDDDLNLKWLYDIHLIAQAMPAAEWDQLRQLASEREVAAVCVHSLRLATRYFETPMPSWVRTDVSPTRSERSAAYLRPRRKIAVVFDDLRALASWRDRARLVREHMFPAEAYMRQHYAPGSTAPLPVLYGLRLVRGVRKWLSLTL
jgi:hypothetical protein